MHQPSASREAVSGQLEHWIGSIPHGTGPLRSSRPPSLVCSLGGVITNTVQDRGARCRGSVVPPLPDGDGGVTDRATRGACSAGSGVVRCTTSLGLRSPYDASHHRLGFVWGRTTPGWASPSIFISCLPCTCRGWRERDEWSWDGREKRKERGGGASSH